MAAGGWPDQVTSPVIRPIVIGGGPAGSAAAITLAKGGNAPLLFERSSVTGDAICGGFLSWQSLASLTELGIEPATLGGHTVDRVRLFCGTRSVETALPQLGMGLSRRRLDAVMLDAAAAAGARIERGVKVQSVDNGQATLADGSQHHAPDIFLATGKHGLPGHPRPAPSVSADDPVVGLRMRYAANATTTGLIGSAVELFLFDRGYAGLVQQEDGSANLCLAVHKSRLTESGGRPETLIADWAKTCGPLGDRLGQTDVVAPINAIAAIPYGWQVRSGTAGLWRLGDQAACIPSLAGEGMGIALYTGISAAGALLAGEDSATWQLRTAHALARPMRVARLAWRVAEQPVWNQRAVGLLGQMPWLIGVMARLTRVPAGDSR